jgi:Flp pilus assembly protein TadD
MQTIQTPRIQPVDVGFTPIPTRIKDTPPLVVDTTESESKKAVVSHLGDLAQRLAQIHRTAAEGYLSQGMYSEALPHLEAAVTFAKDNAEYQNQLGFVRYICGDDQGAVGSFQRALELQPANPDGWFNLGMVQYGQGRFAEAEDSFRISTEHAPNNPETWNNRGVALHRLGRINDARICFQRALQIDPSNADAKANLAS